MLTSGLLAREIGGGKSPREIRVNINRLIWVKTFVSI